MEKKEFVDLKIPDIRMMSDAEIDFSINNVLSTEEYIKEINDLIIENEKERYVRALLNRLNKIVKYMEEFKHDMETGGISVNLVIDIAKGKDISCYEQFFKYGDKHQQELFEMLRK